MLIIRKVLAATAVSVVMTVHVTAPALALTSTPSKQSVPMAVKVTVTKEKVVRKALESRARPLTSRSHARIVMKGYGWASPKQWTCLNKLWTHESNWRPKAFNKVKVDGKNAGGIPQILGLDPGTPMPIQVKRGLDYIENRYDHPCRAWRFWQENGWY